MKDQTSAALTAHQAAEDRADSEWEATLADVRERWDANPEDMALAAIRDGLVDGHANYDAYIDFGALLSACYRNSPITLAAIPGLTRCLMQHAIEFEARRILGESNEDD